MRNYITVTKHSEYYNRTANYVIFLDGIDSINDYAEGDRHNPRLSAKICLRSGETIYADETLDEIMKKINKVQQNEISK